MKKSLKAFCIAGLVIILVAILLAYYKIINGNYFLNASFITSGFIVLAGHCCC
jgi:hypothetical protein